MGLEYDNRAVYMPATNRFVNPFTMGPDDFDIQDVIMGLPNICRFGGNVPKFYSVASHCCDLSLWFHGRNMPEHAKYALVHDAMEVYTDDVRRPIKYGIPGFLDLEARLELVLLDYFGFEDQLVIEEVRMADIQATQNEFIWLMNTSDPFLNVDPLDDYNVRDNIDKERMRTVYEEIFYGLFS